MKSTPEAKPQKPEVGAEKLPKKERKSEKSTNPKYLPLKDKSEERGAKKAQTKLENKEEKAKTEGKETKQEKYARKEEKRERRAMRAVNGFERDGENKKKGNKKRKRESDEHEWSSKKQLTDAGADNLKVQATQLAGKTEDNVSAQDFPSIEDVPTGNGPLDPDAAASVKGPAAKDFSSTNRSSPDQKLNAEQPHDPEEFSSAGAVISAGRKGSSNSGTSHVVKVPEATKSRLVLGSNGAPSQKIHPKTGDSSDSSDSSDADEATIEGDVVGKTLFEANETLVTKGAAVANDIPRTKEKQTAIKPIIFKMVEDVGEWGPVVAHMPGLSIKFDTPLKAYSRPQKQPEKRVERTPWSQELLLHNEAHPTLDYTAKVETSGGTDAYLRHYIGIYDPETREVQVVPARQLTVRSTLKSAREARGEDSDNTTPKTKLQSKQDLIESFGSKKAQRNLQALQKNAITSPLGKKRDASGKPIIDAAAAAVFASMGQVAMPTSAELQAATDAAKPVPKPNLEAKTPAEVYTIETLIGESTLKHVNIQHWEEAVRGKVDVQTTSRFVSNRLTTTIDANDRSKTRMLKYLLALIQVKQSLIKPYRSADLRLPKPADAKLLRDVESLVLESITSKFAPEGSLDQWHVDYLITHICAIAVVIDSFESDIHDLCGDLGLEVNQMGKYCKELGCKFEPVKESLREKLRLTRAAASSSHRMAILKIPLTFPKARKGPPRRA